MNEAPSEGFKAGFHVGSNPPRSRVMHRHVCSTASADYQADAPSSVLVGGCRSGLLNQRV